MNKEDFRLLQSSVRTLPEKDLESALEALWTESDRKAMDPEQKTEVRAMLRRSLCTTMKKPSLNWRNVAIAILLPLSIFSVTLLFVTARQSQPQKFTVRSPKGQKTQISLPDGTTVWINSASQITYNSNYNKGNRYIRLKGEAFFDVEKNEKTMFIVDVDGIAVNVRGTAFNVAAYEGDSIVSVSLNRGKVDLADTGRRHTIASLSPNQQVTVNRNSLYSELTDCDAELNSLWTQNRLKLEDVGTEELFKKMEHWYGVNINISGIDPDNIYSLTIKTESLREMLDLINRLTPITYRINGEEVDITYKK